MEEWKIKDGMDVMMELRAIGDEYLESGRQWSVTGRLEDEGGTLQRLFQMQKGNR